MARSKNTPFNRGPRKGGLQNIQLSSETKGLTSWWTRQDREGFTQTAESHRIRMAYSKEGQRGRGFTEGKDW